MNVRDGMRMRSKRMGNGIRSRMRRRMMSRMGMGMNEEDEMKE